MPLRLQILRWGAFLGGFTLSGVFFASHTYFLYERVFKQPIGFGRALAWTLPGWYVWALLALAVIGLARRFPLAGPGWKRSLAVHAAACVVLAIVQIVAGRALVALLEGGVGWGRSLVSSLLFRFHWNVLFYASIVAATHALDAYRRDREREVCASQLEARLARAEIHALRAQLHPHFLFNTLHAVSSLMHFDVVAADRVLARLGDLLRAALAGADDQEQPLHQEMRLVESYLEIEKTRLADRLRVRLEVAPGVLEALVPSLILQPLVENAVRHGAREGGEVAISVARRDGVLEMVVSDDGPGLPAPGELREGLGLANTRARLARLYGSAHRFVLGNRPEGGAQVRVELPYRTGPG